MAKKKEVERKDPSKLIRFAKIVSSTAAKEQETKTVVKKVVKTWIQGQVDSQVARFQNRSVIKATAKLKIFAKFEMCLSALLVFFPIFLIVFNGWPTGPEKESISAYHEMTNPNNLVAFYFPLTAAAMLFIVNGFVRRKEHDPWHSYYNVYLGIMLSGVILFNNTDFSILHNIFAILFFGGNVLVIYFVDTLFFQKKQNEIIFNWILLGVIVLSLLLFWPFKVINLFFLEWISLLMISVHFILLSFSTERHRTRVGTARI